MQHSGEAPRRRQLQPAEDKRIQPVRVCPDVMPIDPQKHRTGGKGRPFVPVHKGVVDKQAFQQGAGFFHNIRIVAALGPVCSRLQPAHIPNAGRPAIPFNKNGVHAQNIGNSQVIPAHFASSLYRASCSIMLTSRASSTWRRAMGRLRFSM